MKSKYNILLIAAAFVASLSLNAQPLVLQRTELTDSRNFCGLPVSGVTLERHEGLMSIGMKMELSDYELTGDRVAVFTPVLRNGVDSIAFEPVGLYSRIRYIQYLRGGENALGGPDEASYRYAERPSSIDYSRTIPYAEWMNGASLYLRRSDYGCCRELTGTEIGAIASWREVTYKPQYHYVNPAAETVKMRELSGSAFIDFPVNRTEIYSDYRKNPVELAKIIATIDSVRNDSDIEVRRITIKGYASPEGSYSNNTRLAKGRTEALKQYVNSLYRFENDFIATDYEPEDWAGLRRFVEHSDLAGRSGILELIDDMTLDPDAKDLRIKQKYAEDYKYLLATVYPALRHSDYTIEYTIRQFSNTEEIREALEKAPQKLSLNEMYLLAQELEAGSEDFNTVFETAVRMYPGDETANLNAANSAMQRNDFVSAEKYLAKAGDSAEAVYARGVYALLTGNYALAKELISASKLPETASLLEYLEEVSK